MPIEVRQLPDHPGPNLVCVDEWRSPRSIDGEAIATVLRAAAARTAAPDAAYIHEQGTKLFEGRWVQEGAGIAGSVVYGSPTPSVAAGKTLGV